MPLPLTGGGEGGGAETLACNLNLASCAESTNGPPQQPHCDWKRIGSIASQKDKKEWENRISTSLDVIPPPLWHLFLRFEMRSGLSLYPSFENQHKGRKEFSLGASKGCRGMAWQAVS